MTWKGYAKASAVVIVLFAIGLLGYFAFSAAFPDGLEKVMEENGVEEAEQIWSAPLSYGEDWGGALIAGLIGFALTFGLAFLYLRGMRSRQKA